MRHATHHIHVGHLISPKQCFRRGLHQHQNLWTNCQIYSLPSGDTQLSASEQILITRDSWAEPGIAATFFKHFSNIFQTFFKYFLNIFQTFFKHFQTIFKHFSNIFQTFFKHFSKIFRKILKNQSISSSSIRTRSSL